MRELGKNDNQPGDWTQQLKNPHGGAAIKPKLSGGCNMRPRLLSGAFPQKGTRRICRRIHSKFQEAAMTQKQRLIYSILIALSVLAIMLGLSWAQNAGMITEKTFQYVAIGVAVVVVVINGVMRRKVKP